MKYRPNNHIIGKVYDLTQDNMNAMIKHIEELKEANKLVILRNVAYHARIEKFRVVVGIDHDTYYPAGKCDLCDVLRNDYESDDHYEEDEANDPFNSIPVLPERDAVKKLRKKFKQRQAAVRKGR